MSAHRRGSRIDMCGSGKANVGELHFEDAPTRDEAVDRERLPDTQLSISGNNHHLRERWSDFCWHCARRALCGSCQVISCCCCCCCAAWSWLTAAIQQVIRSPQSVYGGARLAVRSPDRRSLSASATDMRVRQLWSVCSRVAVCVRVVFCKIIDCRR